MFTHVSQMSSRRLPRGLAIIFTSTLLVQAFARTPVIGAENVDAVNEPTAKIIVDPPQPDRLARGVVFIQIRTENLQLMPVFGPAALAVEPRIGHLHVTLDDDVHWAHTSGEPLILAGLTPGSHSLLIEAVDANHQPLAESVVKFDVPQPSSAQPDGKSVVQVAAQKPHGTIQAAHVKHRDTAAAPSAEQSSAAITVDPPKPALLARGVAFINYRTENLQVVPLFGPAAAAISPRVGHLHVTVDDAPWHWVNSSGGPVIVGDLCPGPHKIVLELADANHQPLGERVVKFEVPQR